MILTRGSIGPPFLFLVTSKLHGNTEKTIDPLWNQSSQNKIINKTSRLDATIKAKSRNFSLHPGVTVIFALVYVDESRGLTGRSEKSNLVSQKK